MPSYRGLLEKRILFTLAVFPGAAQSFFLLFQLALYFYFKVSVVHVLVRLLKHAPIHPRIDRLTDNRKCSCSPTSNGHLITFSDVLLQHNYAVSSLYALFFEL